MRPSDASGPVVELDRVSKLYGETVAVDDVSLALRARAFTALLGPSGCGKTTVLSMIAGLLAPDQGDIRLDGVSMARSAPERRPVSIVFQKTLLFPHLSVEQNVGFGLRMGGLARSEVRRRSTEMLELVQLAGLGSRHVRDLSGGQEQRVALARALVLAPRVLLLDEPFSQLDTGLRTEMRALVRGLHDDLEVTTLFVTHDQTEAVAVADEVALMLAGVLAGQDTPKAFYTAPPSLAAARFFGVTNEVPGRVAAGCFVSADGTLRHAACVADGAAVLVVRPEGLQLTTETGPHCVPGTVVAARFAGTHLVVEVRADGGTRLTVHVPAAEPVSVGGRVAVRVPPQACTVFTQPR